MTEEYPEPVYQLLEWMDGKGDIEKSEIPDDHKDALLVAVKSSLVGVIRGMWEEPLGPYWLSEKGKAILAKRRMQTETPTPKKRTGRPRKGETDGQAKVLAAIKVLLRDKEHGLDSPPTGKKIADTAKVSENTVKNCLKEWFNGNSNFKAAWRRDDVKGVLAKMEYLPESHQEYRE